MNEKEGRELSEAFAAVGTPEGRRLLEAHLKTLPFPHYEQTQDGMLVLIKADGTRTVGRFVDRTFVEEKDLEFKIEQVYHDSLIHQLVTFFVMSRRQSRRFRQKNDHLNAAYLAGKAQAYLNCVKMLRRGFPEGRK